MGSGGGGVCGSVDNPSPPTPWADVLMMTNSQLFPAPGSILKLSGKRCKKALKVFFGRFLAKRRKTVPSFNLDGLSGVCGGSRDSNVLNTSCWRSTVCCRHAAGMKSGIGLGARRLLPWAEGARSVRLLLPWADGA